MFILCPNEAILVCESAQEKTKGGSKNIDSEALFSPFAVTAKSIEEVQVT